MLLDYVDDINKSFIHTVDESILKAVAALSLSNVIYTAGNGGSSSTASHFTQDLMKACHRKSVCMSDNVGFITATANDVNFDLIFSSYLYLNSEKESSLVCISGSGNSKNLLEAVFTAKKLGIYTISLVGFDGGKLKEISDLTIHTSIFDMRKAESAHSIILHYIIDKLGGI